MKITILLFATLKDLIGQRKLELDIPHAEMTVNQIREYLSEQYPDAEPNIRSALVAINEEYAFTSDVLKDGDSIALFPPVSGGTPDESPDVYLLPHEPFSHDELLEKITTPSVGAIVTFSGVVRGITNKKGHIPETQHLEYEAYESMAIAKMKQVAQEIREKFPLIIGIAMVQRLGKLDVGQNTVVISCSSPHRDDSCFDAARYGIDRLKEIVPVWKKEVGQNGQQWIEGEYIPDESDRNP